MAEARVGIFAVPDATSPQSTLVNVMGLDGEPDGWADELARIVTELRFTTMLVAVPSDDPVDFVRRLGEDVAPRVRSLLG